MYRKGSIALDAIDLEDRITDSTTRRTVVKTGVKLAYTAPLVAASFKLSAMTALAAVSGGGGVCSPPSSTCSAEGPSGCSGNALCSCGATVDGTTACFQWNVVGTGGSCSVGDPCPSGEACIAATCVGDICQPLCAAGESGFAIASAPEQGPNTK
jgi:hypothetical protein